MGNVNIIRLTYHAPHRKPEVLKGLYEMGFQKPSKVQEKALPLMLADPPQNMIAQSQSGTGKTAAFVTTLLSRIDTINMPNQPQAIVLAPSRELARQIQSVVQHIGRPTPNLYITAAIKGAIAHSEHVNSSVIIGTPGTVSDLCKHKQLDTSKMKLLVIDEADNMLDMQGLGVQSVAVKK
jgi:ATP-dependent RNA helicase DDX19/DBP5